MSIQYDLEAKNYNIEYVYKDVLPSTIGNFHYYKDRIDFFYNT